jgi:hypothetical protein
MELEQIVNGLSQHSCLGVFATAVSAGASYWFDNSVRYVVEFTTESLKRKNRYADLSLARSLWYHVGDLPLPLAFGGVVSVVDYLKDQDPLLALATGGAFTALVAIPQQIVKYGNSFIRNRRTLDQGERKAFEILHQDLRKAIDEFDLKKYRESRNALDKYLAKVSQEKRSARLIVRLNEELKDDLIEGDTKHFTWAEQYKIIRSVLDNVRDAKTVYSASYNDLNTLRPRLVSPGIVSTRPKYSNTNVIVVYKDDYNLFGTGAVPGQKAEIVDNNSNPVYVYKFNLEDVDQSSGAIRADLDLEQKDDWINEEQLVDLVRQYSDGANLLLIGVGDEVDLDVVKDRIAVEIYEMNQLHRTFN